MSVCPVSFGVLAGHKIYRSIFTKGVTRLRQFIEWMMTFSLSEFQSIALLKMIMASVCGALVGLEREMKGRPAGLKTFSLVCLGSALVIITNDYICQFITSGNGDMARMAAQVISGIGFLGAGSIMVTNHNQVRGLTTAAALWVTAALGITIGAGFYFGGIAGLFVLYISSAIYKYIDRKIMEKSRIMKVYVEGQTEEFMLDLIDYFSQEKFHVLSLQRKSENKWYSQDACATIEVDFGKRVLHKKVLECIREITGIRYVEEI